MCKISVTNIQHIAKITYICLELILEFLSGAKNILFFAVVFGMLFFSVPKRYMNTSKNIQKHFPEHTERSLKVIF